MAGLCDETYLTTDRINHRKAKLTKSRAAENNQQNTLTKFHSLLKGKSRIPRVSLPKLVGALCIE
jgi:hypothetical protein